MRIFIRFLAIFLTALIILSATVVAVYVSGYLFFIYAFGLGGIVMVATLITQIILYAGIRKCRSMIYDFFFFASYTSSALLLLIYYICSLMLTSLQEMKDSLKMQQAGVIGYDSEVVVSTDSGSGLSGYLGIQLLFLIPIFIQIALTVSRSKKLNWLAQQDRTEK